MGYDSRLPNSNDKPEPRKKSWQPKDETAALLQGKAVRCCGCGKAVLLESARIKQGGRRKHAFCPDHKVAAACRFPDNFNHHFNIADAVDKST